MWSILNIAVALVKIFPQQSSSAPSADQEAQVVVLVFCFSSQFKTKQKIRQLAYLQHITLDIPYKIVF